MAIAACLTACVDVLGNFTERSADSGEDGSVTGCPVEDCLPGAVCQTDEAGNKTCVETCTDTDASACASGLVCAPMTDTSGNPVGPYVCKPNDGQSYDGCGTAACNGCATSGFSCARVGTNQTIYYCGRNCEVDSDCAAAGVCCLPMTACGECPVGGSCGPGLCGPC
jgi:hypothetical protein